MTEQFSKTLKTPRSDDLSIDVHDLLMHGKRYEIWWEAGYWYIKAMHTATVRRFCALTGLADFLARLEVHLAAQQSAQEVHHAPHRPAA